MISQADTSTCPEGGEGAHVVSPTPRDVWHRVVTSDPDALVSQTPEWIDAMVETGGWRDGSLWYVAPDGRDLVLPIARRRFGGALATGTSFGEGWGFGGLVAEGGVRSADVELVLRDLARKRALRTTIRINPVLADQWARGAANCGVTARPRHAHVLDLRVGVDAIWKAMDTRARGGVRRARRLGVEIECDTTGAKLPVFYGLLLESFKRWAGQHNEPKWLALLRGRRRDPLRKFEVIAKRIGSALRLYIAWREGRPAAAVLVLVGANAHYTRGVMDTEVLGNSKASELLLWHAIEDACREGCAAFHMGETAPGSSLATYKEKYGAVLMPYAEYELERLPITRMERTLRGFVKRVIRYRDA